MNVNFLIADLVSKLNVGSRARVKSIKVKYSSIVLRILILLYKNGVISQFNVKGNIIDVKLKYKQGTRVISSIKVISKPSKRVYYTLSKLNLMLNSNSFSGFYILSTSKGLLTSNECLLMHHLSGEVILKVEI